jgi:signal peptidase II
VKGVSELSNKSIRNKLTAFVAFMIIAVLVGIDRLTKWLIVTHIPYRASVPWLRIGEFKLIDFTHLHNDGAAFGFLSGQQTFLISVTSLFLLGAIIFLLVGVLTSKLKSKLMIFTVVLIISGGVGNLIDRVSQGYVVDFIELKFVKFAIFNFADICAVLGAILLFWLVLSEEIRDFRARRACGVLPYDDELVQLTEEELELFEPKSEAKANSE